MIRTILLSSHAIAGLIALVFAVVVLRPPASADRWTVRVYLSTLLAMLGFVIALVMVDWAELDVASQITFSLLLALGVFTAYRGVQAYRALREREPGWRERYVDHVGFTVISLFDGFTIVGAIDLGAPLPVVIVVGVLGVVVGITAINAVKRRLPVPAAESR